MKSLRPRKKWIIIFLGFLLALLILKVILLWTAKPKAIFNYVAEYNKITLPHNFDPIENAEIYYQKAFDNFIEMPQQVDYAIHRPTLESQKINEKYYLEMLYGKSHKSGQSVMPTIQIDWPTDFNNEDRNALRNWLSSNGRAFEYFRNASRKPYYWLERIPKGDNYISNMLFPETGSFRELAEVLIWNAKSNASDGKLQSSFEDILACYRAGQHKCMSRSLLFEQLHGYVIKDRALSSLIQIIDRVQIDSKVLGVFQNTLQSQFDEILCVPDFEAERLNAYDTLQRIFVYNKKGTGRLACSFVKVERSFCDGSYQFKHAYKMLLACLFGPTTNEMAKRIEEKFATYESAKTETPSQLRLQNAAYLKKLEVPHCNDCKEGFILGEVLFPNFYSVFNANHRLKAKEKAVLTILAVHRFKADNGTLPTTLNELVSAGYLQKIPLDPYSDGALIYKRMNDTFILYSFGEDFKDNGGYPNDNGQDILFWPVRRFEHPEKQIEE